MDDANRSPATTAGGPDKKEKRPRGEPVGVVVIVKRDWFRAPENERPYGSGDLGPSANNQWLKPDGGAIVG